MQRILNHRREGVRSPQKPAANKNPVVGTKYYLPKICIDKQRVVVTFHFGSKLDNV